jgi:ATP-binding cassette subfamily B multidrug efflux pump
MREAMDGKTVIAIAHRLSTVMDMDRLIVLQRGVIVADGSHAQLLRQGGLYAELWRKQSGESVPLPGQSAPLVAEVSSLDEDAELILEPARAVGDRR